MNVIITPKARSVILLFGWKSIKVEAPKPIKIDSKHSSGMIESTARVLEGKFEGPEDLENWDLHLANGIIVYTAKTLHVLNTLTIDEVHREEHPILIAKGYEAELHGK